MRPLIALLLAALLMLQLKLWLSDDGERKVWRLEEQIRQRTEENSRLAARNAELAAEVQDLKKGLDAAEERARSELGLVKPDESFYEIVEPPPEGR
ncbi:MAG TPA: cell division protein FtsB [Gammaproteobacteria bacterium]|nr:cell division protein FtsB [Gammaproteobacteria bacterium]